MLIFLFVKWFEHIFDVKVFSHVAKGYRVGILWTFKKSNIIFLGDFKWDFKFLVKILCVLTEVLNQKVSCKTHLKPQWVPSLSMILIHQFLFYSLFFKSSVVFQMIKIGVSKNWNWRARKFVNVNMESTLFYCFKFHSLEPVEMSFSRQISPCVKSIQIRSFFWSIFSYIRTEYGNLRSESVQIRSFFLVCIWTLSRSACSKNI